MAAPWRGKHYAIAGAVLAGVALLAYGLTAVLTSGTPGRGLASTASNSPSPCVLASAAFQPIPTGFTGMVGQTMTELPIHQAPGQQSQHGFLGGRLLGYINNVALSEPYLSEERALALSLGYKPGKWPLVPLQGSVVSATPGILELYEGHFVFDSPDGADFWVGHLVGSEALDSYGHGVDMGLPSGFTAFETIEGPNDGRHEHAVIVYGMAGDTAIQLSIQGGSQITGADEKAFVLDTLAHLRARCPNN